MVISFEFRMAQYTGDYYREDAPHCNLKHKKDGWWEGILGDPSGNGRAGLFPHNYVEVLPN